jgi:hypothetical protein
MTKDSTGKGTPPQSGGPYTIAINSAQPTTAGPKNPGAPLPPKPKG